jgi:glucose uptake protein GlcU
MEYSTIIIGMVAFAVLIAGFAILSRDRDELQKAYEAMLKENQKLSKMNDEMLESNYQLLKKIRTNGIK